MLSLGNVCYEKIKQGKVGQALIITPNIFKTNVLSKNVLNIK